jgi:hypothetical protein
VKYKIRKSPVISDRAKSVHCYVDGHRMEECMLLPHKTGGKVTGMQTSDNTVRPFKFADIQTTGVEYPLASNRSVTLTLCPRVVQTKIYSPKTPV